MVASRWAARVRRPPVEPESVFDDAMQHERTTLAWERTSVSLMVVGAIMVREAALLRMWPLVVGGIGGVLVGAGLLVWSGIHYAQVHERLRRGHSPVRPIAVRAIGLASIVGIGLALVLAVASVLAE